MMARKHQPLSRPKFQIGDHVLWKLWPLGKHAKNPIVEATGMITEIRIKFAGGPTEKFSYHIVFDRPLFKHPIQKQVHHIWSEDNFELSNKVDYVKEFRGSK